MNQNLHPKKLFLSLKIVFLHTIFLLATVQLTIAQKPSGTVITGKVTDAQTSSPMTGVTVSVKGTKIGVSTDAEGNFSVSAPAGATLTFSYIGYKSLDIQAGSKKQINIQLQHASGQMQDVVVTALGISRERRSVGYSVTEVEGSTLTEARENSFVNGLEGKVAGGGNVSGVATGPNGATNVVIRGIAGMNREPSTPLCCQWHPIG